jgi:MarR family transcriptional regulator, 2-MHQ and catechol-resistance regulon repressor
VTASTATQSQVQRNSTPLLVKYAKKAGFSLEILLNKGPLPVNTIGPIVDLTPGSISIAVDRLVAKDLVSRVESAEDRRVRIVSLTPLGKDLIVSAFKKHSGQMKNVFSDLTAEELRGLELKLKKVGKRAATLMEERNPPDSR